MKKILTLLALMLTFTTINAIPSDTIYNDVKTLLKDDLKGVVAYTADKGEQGVKYLFNKADTVLNTAYSTITKGSIHTYQILKTQQLVKSFHHLFYFLLGIAMTFVLFYRVKVYLKENSTEASGFVLVITCILYVVLTIFNAFNFNEMLTGFINPEYGAIKEILELFKKIKQ